MSVQSLPSLLPSVSTVDAGAIVWIQTSRALPDYLRARIELLYRQSTEGRETDHKLYHLLELVEDGFVAAGGGHDEFRDTYPDLAEWLYRMDASEISTAELIESSI